MIGAEFLADRRYSILNDFEFMQVWAERHEAEVSCVPSGDLRKWIHMSQSSQHVPY